MRVEIPGLEFTIELWGKEFTLSFSGFQIFLFIVALWATLTIGLVIYLSSLPESKTLDCSSGVEVYYIKDYKITCL